MYILFHHIKLIFFQISAHNIEITTRELQQDWNQLGKSVLSLKVVGSCPRSGPTVAGTTQIIGGQSPMLVGLQFFDDTDIPWLNDNNDNLVSSVPAAQNVVRVKYRYDEY